MGSRQSQPRREVRQTVKKRRLVLRPEARRELEQAVEWYETQLPDLGRQFRTEVYRTFDNIIARPELYPQARSPARKAVLRRFPYLIFYLVETKQIVIVAVFHAKRGPVDIANRA
jgi:plasmid stabilization system protein ParE